MPKRPSKKRQFTELKKFVWEHGLVLKEIEQVTGIGTSRLNWLCIGRAEATPAERQALCRALCVEEEEIFPRAQWEDLSAEEATQAKLSAWLSSPEGALICRRISEVLS